MACVFALFLMMSIALAGCAALSGGRGAQAVQYTINVGMLAKSIIVVDPEIASAESDIDAHKGVYSAAEWQTLKGSKVHIDAARATVANIVTASGGGGQAVVSMSTLQSVYQNAKIAYLKAKPIIENHKSSLSAQQLMDLQQLDRNATQLNDDYARVVSSKVGSVNVTALMQQALTVAAMGAKIAVVAGL
jgi:hypothetical protein